MSRDVPGTSERRGVTQPRRGPPRIHMDALQVRGSLRLGRLRCKRATNIPRLASDAFTRHRYNGRLMAGLVYAAVAYVRDPVGIFVEALRRELHPAHTHADAHVTILPPRPLGGTEQAAIDLLGEVCKTAAPFEVTMGEVETFIPVTPTVFLRVARGAYRMREMHDKFNRDALEFKEPWPYMPHLTIAKMDTPEEARKVLAIANQRWGTYSESRVVHITSLTFVKGIGERWVNLAEVPLGTGSAK
jgi:2'-5' RNA ligase